MRRSDREIKDINSIEKFIAGEQILRIAFYDDGDIYIVPVNYGYVPNTISGDGEELDCYLLGIFEPVDEFEGKCIAIIHRLDDNDDKLMVMEYGRNYSDEQIRALTEFQEQYFESIIIRE